VPGDGHVTGKVAFADGKVPASFTVALGNTDPRPFATKDGTFTVPAVAGTHTLVVDGRGFLASKAKEVTIVEGKTADAGTIVVTPGRSISGRVLDTAGLPVAKATVAAGALLSGGGAELYIESESVGAKSIETDADGRFSLEGFPPAAITVVAGKADLGRSPSLRLPASPDSATLELVLQKTTGLEGTVTRDGKPLGDTVIIANPFGATSSNFFVMTGADGTFALDTLAPGSYVVYPMIGGGGNRPKDMYVIKVTLSVGVRSKVTIDASAGPVTVAVNVKTTGGTKVPMAQLFMIQATLPDLLTAGGPGGRIGLLRQIDQLGVFGDKPTPIHMRAAMGGTGEINGVHPGQYTVCAMPVFGPPPDDPESLPIKCVPAKIGAATKQTVDIVVPDPKP
jgi:Carboxypeptidase regulatory-like domain